MEPLTGDDCFALCQASRFISRLYGHHLARAGLTTTQYSIIDHLHRLGEMTAYQLSVAMVVDRRSIMPSVRLMQRDGLVESRTDAARELTIALTASGAARLEIARVHWATAQSEFEQRFGSRRMKALRHELCDLTDKSRSDPT
jgi:DNA-binding MarR family transcriptional regulator